MISRRGALRTALCCIIAAMLLVFTGCSWTGKGKDVATGMKQAVALKSMTFSGSISMKMSGPGAAANGSENLQMSLSGGGEGDGPRSKMWMDTDVAGTRISVAAPGDGNTYTTVAGRTYGAPVTDDKATDEGFDKVLLALESAIGKFREGGAQTTEAGLKLRTVVANADVDDLCESVLPAFNSFTGNAASSDQTLNSITGGKTMTQLCKTFLSEPPTLWFGLDDSGLLRMIASDMKIAVPGAQMTMTMRFDILTANQPVTVKKPAGARMLPSKEAVEQELKRAVAASTGR